MIGQNLYKRVIHRAALALGTRGVSPATLTYAGLIAAAACCWAAAVGFFDLAALLLLLSGFCDVLDGAIARGFGKATPQGALLDSTLDRLCDAAPMIGLTVFYAHHGALAAIPVAALVAGFSISYIRARAEALGAKLPSLWMRRAERLSIIVVAFLAGRIAIPGAAVPAPTTLLVVACLALICGIASIHLFRVATRILAQRPSLSVP